MAFLDVNDYYVASVGWRDAFQDCIDAAVATNPPLPICVPAGDYVIVGTLRIPAGAQVRIEGDGRGLSIITFVANATGMLVNDGGLLVLLDLTLRWYGDQPAPPSLDLLGLEQGALLRATRCELLGGRPIKSVGLSDSAVTLWDCRSRSDSSMLLADTPIVPRSGNASSRARFSGCWIESKDAGIELTHPAASLQAVGCTFSSVKTAIQLSAVDDDAVDTEGVYASISVCHFASTCAVGVATSVPAVTQISGSSWASAAVGHEVEARGSAGISGCVFGTYSGSGKLSTASLAAVSAEPVALGTQWVGLLACDFSGWWVDAAVDIDDAHTVPVSTEPKARRPPPPRWAWALAGCRFANVSGSAPNVRYRGNGRLSLVDCEFTDVVGTGAHADVRSKSPVSAWATATARFEATRCRVDARPFHILADASELVATLTACEFLAADTLELGTLGGGALELHGAENVFAASALSLSWVFTDVRGFLRPRAAPAAAHGPTGITLSVDPSADIQPISVATVFPIDRILPEMSTAAPRVFQGPWYFVESASGIEFATGGISPGAIDYLVSTGSSGGGELRAFILDSGTTSWREL